MTFPTAGILLLMKAIPNCPRHRCAGTDRVTCWGTYFRKDDSRTIQRFRCGNCRRGFSSATFAPAYRQKKRRFNRRIFWMLGMKVSMRAISLYSRLSMPTIGRKLVYLGLRSGEYLHNLPDRDVKAIQFDELQSSIHTKCKPVSIPIVVGATSRRILSVKVASMPAQHPLVDIALKRYGPRNDDRPAAIQHTLAAAKHMLATHVEITTDMAPRYPDPIRTLFPQGRHSVHRSRRARHGGQGELKRGRDDPLFSLNHTAAMVRDGVGRMVRKTWGNSKRMDRLELHLQIYAQFHNEVRVAGNTTNLLT